MSNMGKLVCLSQSFNLDFEKARDRGGTKKGGHRIRAFVKAKVEQSSNMTVQVAQVCKAMRAGVEERRQ